MQSLYGQENAFVKLKDYVLAAPILQGPNWNISFHIATDASDTILGAILGQLETVLGEC